MARPSDPLPRSAARIVKASRCLSPGLKLVWLEDLYLDCGPDGCFMNAAGIAERIGFKTWTVRKYRQRLVAYELHAGEKREGRWTWYVTLPPECWPGEAADLVLARRLDDHLSRIHDTGISIPVGLGPAYQGAGTGIPVHLSKTEIRRERRKTGPIPLSEVVGKYSSLPSRDATGT